MTSAELIAASVLWTAAAYRTVLAMTRPTWWRAWLSISVAAVALAATGYPFREQLDAASGVPNLTNLAGRCLLCLAVVGAQSYLVATRRPDATGRVRTRAVVAGVTAAAISCTAWSVAPIHDLELSDLSAAPRHPASFVYAVAIYLYLAWFLADLWAYARRSYRTARTQDPPAASVIAIIAASILAGLVTLLSWTAHVSLTQLVDTRVTALNSVAAVFFPLSMTLFACGMLALPVAATISHHLAARRLSRELEPLWRVVLSSHPEVELPNHQLRLFSGLDSRWTAQRRLIEVSDGLEAHKVSSVGSLDDLAMALRAPTLHEVDSSNAKDALVRIDSAVWPQPLLDLSAAVMRQRQVSRRGS